MASEVPDISEELVLGRTLLEQGHLGTAQRVLVKVCQENPENAEAFRGLSEILHRKGDEVRAQVISEYAQDLREAGAENRGPAPRPLELKVQRPAKPQNPPPVPVRARVEPATPRVEVSGARVTPQLEISTPRGERVTPNVVIGDASNRLPESPAVAGPAPTMPSPGLPVPPLVSGSAPTMPSPGIPAPLSAETVSSAAEQGPAAHAHTPAATSGKWKILAGVAALVLLASAGILAYRILHPAARRSTFSPREELDSALASGSFDRLMRVRERARAALAGSAPDADALVRLALVDGYLALDYGVATTKGADEALRRLPAGGEVKPQRVALAETAAGLLALAAGDRASASQHVQAGLAKAASQPPPVLLLASARLHSLAGELAAAGGDLDRALAAAPDFAPVVADWAVNKLDSGEPAAARRVLRDFLLKNKTASRVHLVAAEVERALGESGWKKHIDLACHGENRNARSLRAACSLAGAQEARLDGERSTAVRKARAAAQTSDDPRVLADSALVLALLGEVDSADEVLAHARKLAADAAVPLAWADLAIRLGRGQADAPTPPTDRPALSERYLVVLRAAYLRGGGKAMAAAVQGMPPGLAELDLDLRTFTELGRTAAPSRSDRSALERRAERGNPVAAFVLGVLAAREDDHKQAARRLEKALAGHGDACRAALLYLAALHAQDRPAQPNRMALRALHERSAACPIPEM